MPGHNMFVPGCLCCGGDPGIPSSCDSNGWPRRHTDPSLDVQFLTLTWTWLGSNTQINEEGTGNTCCQGLSGPRSDTVAGSTTITLNRRYGELEGGSALWYDSGFVAFPAGYPRGAHTVNYGPGNIYKELDPNWPPPYFRAWISCGIRLNMRSYTAAQAAQTPCRPDIGATFCGSAVLNSQFEQFVNRAPSTIYSTNPDSIHYRFRTDRGPFTNPPDVGAVSYDIVDITR